MAADDFFYYAIGGGFLVLVGAITYAVIEVGRTVRAARAVVEDVAETTADLTMLREGIKKGLVKVGEKLLDKWAKGGEESGK